MPQIFTQSVEIQASVEVVDYCITDQTMMHKWLNPLLVCQPIGEWSSDVGSRSRFVIQIPVWRPTLESRVVERNLGLIVWEFTGFFHGQDRWFCQTLSNGTKLVNSFSFSIPNPLIGFGFNLGASILTKRDMEAQLQRLKAIAESYSRA